MEARRWCVCPYSQPATALHRRQSPCWGAHHELYPGAGGESTLCTDCGQRQGLLRSVDARQSDQEDANDPADKTATSEETLCRVPPRADSHGVPWEPS